MKNLERNLERLNSLLQLNREAKEIYQAVSNRIDEEELSTLFRKYYSQRNEFCSIIEQQILKFGTEPKVYNGLGRLNNRNLMSLKKHIENDDMSKLFDEFCRIEQWTITQYNTFLQERNVPLSICKMLVGQRDAFQRNINKIKISELEVA